MDFTARDNLRVRDVKAENILDASAMRELDERCYIIWFGLK